jgi:hypothetical protein
MKNETKLKDPEGNIIISPGLKVRHKKSGFEYTVDSISQVGGKIYILLNLPEEPRFEPDLEPNLIHGSKSELEHKYIYDVDNKVFFYEPEDSEEADKLAVPEKEFVKNYEVK